MRNTDHFFGSNALETPRRRVRMVPNWKRSPGFVKSGSPYPPSWSFGPRFVNLRTSDQRIRIRIGACFKNSKRSQFGPRGLRYSALVAVCQYKSVFYPRGLCQRADASICASAWPSTQCPLVATKASQALGQIWVGLGILIFVPRAFLAGEGIALRFLGTESS